MPPVAPTPREPVDGYFATLIALYVIIGLGCLGGAVRLVTLNRVELMLAYNGVAQATVHFVGALASARQAPGWRVSQRWLVSRRPAIAATDLGS
jgi:hypothetical protein